MKLSDLINLLNGYVDDVIDATTATRLFNAGQNQMAVDIKASFPQLIASNLNDTFVFPEKYHEAPVLYAAAMVKAQDSSIREKESFLSQFGLAVANFTENYDVPARYWETPSVQQFTATAGQTTFLITKESYNPDYSNLKVYINDVPTTSFSLATDGTNSFILTTSAALNDAVTASWEQREEFTGPPMPWWSW
jgi:hypothetical protein